MRVPFTYWVSQWTLFEQRWCGIICLSTIYHPVIFFVIAKIFQIHPYFLFKVWLTKVSFRIHCSTSWFLFILVLRQYTYKSEVPNRPSLKMAASDSGPRSRETKTLGGSLTICSTLKQLRAHLMRTRGHYLRDELHCRCIPCFGSGTQSGVPITAATSIEEQITVGD